MRRKDPDRESVNEAETAEAGDRAAEKRGGGGGVGVAKGGDGVGAVTGLFSVFSPDFIFFGKEEK